MKKNVAGQRIILQGIVRADGTDGGGLSPAITASVDGAAATSAGTVTEKADGAYQYEPSAGETNGDHVLFQLTETTLITQSINVYPIDVAEYKADVSALATAVEAAAIQATVDDNQTELAKVIKSGERAGHVQDIENSTTDVEATITRI